jgi:prepilin-type N-terminal cleavage/methylation domain-containing protein
VPETLNIYAQMGRVAIACLLLPVGMVLGSFSSVIASRLPHGKSIAWPGSHCHACNHPLRAGDLVPVVSFLVLRGKCRYCSGPIGWIYPALELGCGLVGALGALAGGWSLALAGLGLWLAVWVGIALGQRLKDQAGMSLVEVLIASAILAGVLIPMLDFGANLRGGTPFQRQIASTLATSRLEKLGNQAYRTNNTTWPSGGSETVDVGQFTYLVEWTVNAYVPAVNDFSAETAQLRQARITVTCQNCTRPMPPVRMVGILEKL